MNNKSHRFFLRHLITLHFPRHHTPATRVFSSTSPPPPFSSSPAVLLVESPAKAKKIQEYLGQNYTVLASYGHIRDLPAKTGSVDPDTGFSMRWELADGANARVASIAAAVAAAPRLYLATDPDREGEAISWHLLEELKERGSLPSHTNRITFSEVTKSAVEAALAAPRDVSMPLVQAYMARRALDYLFGFNISPLLWRKLPGARSAGRVQSVALRLVADREASIEAFNPQKYWTIHAQVSSHENQQELQLPGEGGVMATLVSVDGTPPPSPGFFEESQAQAIRDRVENASFTVSSLVKKESARHPTPPFTTSTLQQEANKKLGWGASRTMQCAQKLYEAGIITYMRTDGVSIAPHAVEALRTTIATSLGDAFLPATPRVYATKSKNSQEAHEAIRPTDPSRLPASLRFVDGLESGSGGRGGGAAAAMQLYELIRSRALASQMTSARIENVAVEFSSKDGSLVMRATASYTTFLGYLKAYHHSGDSGGSSNDSGHIDDEGGDDGISSNNAVSSRTRTTSVLLSGEAAARVLTALTKGHSASLSAAEAAPHETRPPGRYTEGTLVKALEEVGVGRPSTYAPTLRLLQSRRYVRKEGRALHAEPLGRILSSFLCTYFPTYVDPGFTCSMEEALDEVSAGREGWQSVLSSFWGPFHARVVELGSLTGTEVIDVLNKELELLLYGVSSSGGGGGGGSDDTANKKKDCPGCGKPLSLKLSHRGGPFVGCSAYPECRFSRPIIASDLFGDEEGDGEDGGVGVGVGSIDGGDGAEGNKKRVGGSTAGGVMSGLELAEKFGMRGPVRLLGTDPSTGKHVFVRQGPYGPYVQLGVDSDHEMRRAPLPKDRNLRSVKLSYALALLALPRELGVHPESGEVITVRNGKFGPFVSQGNIRRALSKEYDPMNITLEGALVLLQAARKVVAKKSVRGGVGGEDDKSGGGAQVAAQRGRKKKEIVADKDVVKAPKEEKEKEKKKKKKKNDDGNGDGNGNDGIRGPRSSYILFLQGM